MRIGKLSAIHNLVITDAITDTTLEEGLLVDEEILRAVDIRPNEAIILTRVGGDNWSNRMRTRVLPSPVRGAAVCQGSLARFLAAGDVTCVISEAYEGELSYPIFDLGYDPARNKDNLEGALEVQRGGAIKRTQTGSPDHQFVSQLRSELRRSYAVGATSPLVVNRTHPDCLQGSAEIPASEMARAGIEEFETVVVYNRSRGGMAETYAVPMPEGVVMTTGAMATFAKVGDEVTVMHYSIR